MSDDNPRAVIGDNKPPPYDPEVYQGFDQRADAFIEASQEWLDMKAIDRKDVAESLTDQIAGLAALHKKIEAMRVELKAPHLEAGKLVDTAFNGIKSKIETCGKLLKKKLEPWLIAERARADAEEAARRAEADRQRAEAEEARRKAEESNNLQEQFEAEAKEKEAREAERLAKQKVDATAKSASGAGRTISLRTVREVEIINIRLLFMHYQGRPEVADLLHRLATADVRAKDADPAAIPGIRVTEKKVAA